MRRGAHGDTGTISTGTRSREDHGAQLRAHDDHRIAMALAIAALGASSPSEIEGAECVAVSFPSFFSVLERAAGRA